MSEVAFHLFEQLFNGNDISEVYGNRQNLSIRSERLNGGCSSLQLRGVAADQDDGFGVGFGEGGGEAEGADAGGGPRDDDHFIGLGEGRGGGVDAGVLVTEDVRRIGVGGCEVVGRQGVHF